MAKVTSKLQVTVPKAIADTFGIRPGDDIQWLPAGDSIRVVTARQARPAVDVRERLRRFDEATERQRRREKKRPRLAKANDRGWTREELYDRGQSG